MTAERYLQSVRNMGFKIKRYEKDREDIRAQIGCIKAMSYTPDRIQSSMNQDSLEKEVIKSIERLEKIDKALAKTRADYIEKRSKAYDQIMKMNEGQYRNFLIDYYIDLKSYTDIFYAGRYTDINYLYKLRYRAIKRFEKVVRK